MDEDIIVNSSDIDSSDTADMAKKGEIQGECMVCGLPGVVGTSCTDPECPGVVVGLAEAKEAPEEPEEYEKDLLDDDSVVSLDDLAEEEEKEETTTLDDN
jgi:hypothetical protein